MTQQISKTKRQSAKRAAEIRDLSQARLRESSYRALRSLCCDYADGVLTVRGQVPNFYLKQLVYAELQCLPSLVQVNNFVEVQSPLDDGDSRPGPLVRRVAARRQSGA
jgi:hypothetical protein